MSANRELLQTVAATAFPDAEIEHIGTGGFASTFKITRDGATTAIKIIDPGVGETQRVERELAALRGVDHPNVVRYLGVGQCLHDGTSYTWFEMEFVDGVPLADVFDGPDDRTVGEKLVLLTGVVEGAAAIWAAGTAHRDLSPNNLILTADGRLVIVDLGLARHVDDETMTVLPTPGTPGWMSPEQVGPAPTHGDWRSDQYVLGLVAFRWLTGLSPFAATNFMALWVSPANETVRPIREVDPSIPSAVSDVVERMLAKAPHRRYPNANALVADLVAAAALPVGPNAQTIAFHCTIGHYNNFFTPALIGAMRPDGVIIHQKNPDPTSTRTGYVRDAGIPLYVDPLTHLVRSPDGARPASFQQLPYGSPQICDVFAGDADAREAWCASVITTQLEHSPSAVLAPYFYATSGEFDWIDESLQCAEATRRDLDARVVAEDLAERPAVWTTVAVASRWLTSDTERDRLLTAVTRQPCDTLHLLVHTSQATFSPLADESVFAGFIDVFNVMRDYEVPVVVGRRSTCGLLLLALGATGWSYGEEAKLQNMTPHPEADEGGGPAQPRVYLPELLRTVTPATLQVFAGQRGGSWDLGTGPGEALMAENPTLTALTTEQRILLHQHNLLAMRTQVTDLAGRTPGERRARMRDLIDGAQTLFAQLPDPPAAGDGGAFLATWAKVL